MMVERIRAVHVQELWCKKMPPTAKLFQVYRPQDKSVLDQAPAKPSLDTDSMRSLIRTADSLGKLLQYRQQGFLPNARQQRMAGLAVIELAQAVTALVSCRSYSAFPCPRNEQVCLCARSLGSTNLVGRK